MHRLYQGHQTGHGPETSGVTLHAASRYDLHTRLLGLGVNSRNSRMLIEMANIKPGDKVLDVGCGSGNLTLTARRYAAASGSVFGIDASPEMIDVAREKARRMGSDVVFDLGLIEQMPYPDATFDVVISRLVVHHLPDDLKRRGFREILRVLKPAALCFVADFKPPSNPVLFHLMTLLVGHRMMHTDVWAIPPLLAEAGFVDVTSGPTRSAFLAFISGRKPV